MATSYADSAQAREWDRRYDAWGREKRPQANEFYDYEAAALMRSQLLDERRDRELIERKASAKRVAGVVDQIGEFWGMRKQP